MKLVSIIVSALFMTLSAQAGPRFLNATFESKILGNFQVSLKVSELPNSSEVIPETAAHIQRDNGQIVSMDCVTTARFKEVARLNMKILSPTEPILDLNSLVDVLISNSYPMTNSEELCNTSSLREINKGQISVYQLHGEVPVQLNGETYYLSISAIPFSPQVDVSISGDENRMSIDWLDLFTVSQFHKPSFNYSVYTRKNASTSFLEHGSGSLTLQ